MLNKSKLSWRYILELQIKELRKKDYNKVIQYAIKGMHFNMYLDNKVLLNLYGRYFWSFT